MPRLTRATEPLRRAAIQEVVITLIPQGGLSKAAVYER
jgi:hypothetical protein